MTTSTEDESKYERELILQFVSPRSPMDPMISEGSRKIARKFRPLGFEISEVGKKSSTNPTEVITVEGGGLAGHSFEPKIVKKVTNALRKLHETKGATRLYLRGHGDPKDQTLGGWSVDAVVMFLVNCGIRGRKIDVISITGCQLALTRDEAYRKMGEDWKKAQGIENLNDKEAREYRSRYYKRAEKVYEQPGEVVGAAESFPADFAWWMSRLELKSTNLYGRTEYVKVSDIGRKETSYAAYGEFSQLKGKRPHSKRIYYWDEQQGKMVWRWVYE